MRLPGAAQNFDIAGSRFQQAFQDFDGRGFACAVGTQQTKALAGLDGEVQAAYGFYFPFIGLAQIATLDGDGHLFMINGWKRLGASVEGRRLGNRNGSQAGPE